jgi:[acyl-carrier-protein] S-malonyltransferase
MAALLGLDLEVAEQVAAEAAGDQVCALANDNGGGQVVVSGNAAAVERAMVLAKEKGAKRAIRLPVSAPFHCALMQPAADEMEQALRSAALKAPAMAVITNVTAQPVDDPVEIARLLVEQVTHRVRWREIVLCLRELGVDSLVEIGAGKVLTGLARRIDRDMAARAVGSPEDIEDFFKEL